MNAANAPAALSREGVLHLHKAVPGTFIDSLRSMARHDLLWNNGTWNGEAFDPLRPRALLPESMCRVMDVSFRRHIMTFYPHTSATEWSVLRTLAGAEDSPVRRDFAPPLADAHAADLSALPGVLLIATQDDTIIYGYGWNRLVALRSTVEKIVLNKGDVLLLRGDFIYSAAGYETNNLVVHAYLDTPHYIRELEGSEPHLVALVDDITVVDHNPFCYVYNCEFVASSLSSLRRHLNRYHSFFFGQPRG